MTRPTPYVNGQPAETGCYVEGHWGQYGPDHLADQASAFGWEPKDARDDPRVLRLFADEIDEAGYPEAASMLWEWHTETGDQIVDWLNEHTGTSQYRVLNPEPFAQPGLLVREQNYVWHWRDGEVFLSPMCDGEEDCDDEECAHWD